MQLRDAQGHLPDLQHVAQPQLLVAAFHGAAVDERGKTSVVGEVADHPAGAAVLDLGVEPFDGFDVVAQKGTEHRDEMTPAGFLSNHAGGVLGGISSGQDILVRLALKPTSSLRLPGRGVDTAGQEVEVVTTGRHDPCVGIRATPIAEAMLALVLMDHALRHRGQNQDVVSGLPPLGAQDFGR